MAVTGEPDEAADSRIYSTWWDVATGWADWFNISGGVGQPGGQVAAIPRASEHINVYLRGAALLR